MEAAATSMNEVFVCGSTGRWACGMSGLTRFLDTQCTVHFSRAPLVKVIQLRPPAKKSNKKRTTSGMSQERVRLLASGEASLEELGYMCLPALETILRLLPDDNCANSSGSDPVVYTDPNIELRVRQVCAYYGLERLPLTVAELQGLHDYVLMFAPVRADVESMPAVMLKTWQKACLLTCTKVRPEWADAMRLFIAGDDKALAEHHRKVGTVGNFARRYREFDESGA